MEGDQNISTYIKAADLAASRHKNQRRKGT
jgi:hypothetical protein